MAQLKIVASPADMDSEADETPTKFNRTQSPSRKRKAQEEMAQTKTEVRYEFGDAEWVRVSTRGKGWAKVERVAAPEGGRSLAGALQLLLASGTPFRMASPGVELTGKAQGKIAEEFGVTLYGARAVRVHGKDGSDLAAAIAFGLEDAKVPPLTRSAAADGSANPDNQDGADPTAPDEI